MPKRYIFTTMFNKTGRSPRSRLLTMHVIVPSAQRCQNYNRDTIVQLSRYECLARTMAMIL